MIGGKYVSMRGKGGTGLRIESQNEVTLFYKTNEKLKSHARSFIFPHYLCKEITMIYTVNWNQWEFHKSVNELKWNRIKLKPNSLSTHESGKFMQIAHLFAQAQAHNSNTFVVQLLLCREAAFVLNFVCRDFGATCKRMTWKRTLWSCVKNQTIHNWQSIKLNTKIITVIIITYFSRWWLHFAIWFEYFPDIHKCLMILIWLLFSFVGFFYTKRVNVNVKNKNLDRKKRKIRSTIAVGIHWKNAFVAL